MRGKSKSPREVFKITSPNREIGSVTRAELNMLARSYLRNGMSTKEVAERLPIGLMSVAAIKANMTRSE